MIEVSTYYSLVSEALGTAYVNIARNLCPDQIIAGVDDAASGVKRLLLQRFIATHFHPAPAATKFQINGTGPHMRPLGFVR